LAPGDEFHVSVGIIEKLVELFDGVIKVGAAGIVVKFQTTDQLPWPAEFIEFTFQ